jgi:hypothetical protein
MLSLARFAVGVVLRNGSGRQVLVDKSAVGSSLTWIKRLESNSILYR